MKKFILLSLMLVLSLCQTAVAEVRVFVSISPQKWLVEKIGGEMVAVSVLSGEGQDPHTFEPSMRQMAAISRAHLWFTMDMEFEQHLQAKLKDVAPELRVVDMAHEVEKIPMQPEEEGAHDNNHGHNHHHEPGGMDPHVWLSPMNLWVMADEITDTLSQVDEPNAPLYMKNLELLRAELTRIHDGISAKLSPYAGASFYVFHPSFGYFAKEYGLQQKAVEVGGKSPSPKQLSKLVTMAKGEGVRVIFVQPQFDAKSATVVANGIGGEVVPLNALAEDVGANLLEMAEKIEKAMSQ